MKFLILFFSIVFGFSYDLIVLNKTDSVKLNNIGFVCSKKNSVYVCLSSNDINELKRIKDFLKVKFNINSQITNNSSTFVKKHNSRKTTHSKKYRYVNNSTGKYCIQAGSFKYLSNAKTSFKSYKKYPLARIEKIGNFYTLRIGEGSYKEIKALRYQINKGVIKKCDLIPSRIFVSNFDTNNIQKKVNNSNINNTLLRSTKTSNNKILLKHMYNYLNSGDLVNAKKLALKLKNIYPNDSKLVYGLLFMKEGDFKNSCRIFSSLHTKNGLKLKKDACYTYDIKEGFRVVDAEPKRALALFNKALDYKANDKDALLGKGYAYINLKEYDKAYKIFKDLHKKYPKDKKILEGYINVLYLSKKFDELKKLKDSFPEEFKDEFSSIDFYINLKKAQQLLDQKKYKEAENILIKLYSQRPDNINVLLLLANLYLQTNQLDKSANFFQNVLVISPNNIYALRGLEVIYMKKGDYKKALMYSDKITSLGFKDKSKDEIKKFYYIDLATKYLKANKTEKAKEVLKKAYDLDKKDALVLSLLGDIAFKENKSDLAYLYYAKSYAAEPNNFGIKLKFLYALLKLNLFDQIKIILSKIDTSSLDDKQKANLRKFYVDLYAKYSSYLLNNKEYVKALEVVNRGLLMEDDNYTLLSTKAWICLRLKKYECAKKYFKLALSKKDDNQLRYGLALVYLNLGDEKNAKNILDSIHTNDKDLKIKIAGAYVRMGDINKAKTLLKGTNKPSIQIEKEEEPINVNRNIEEKTFFPNPFLKNRSQLNKKQNILFPNNEKIAMYPVKKKIFLKKNTLLFKEYNAIQKEIAKIEQNYISNLKIGIKIRNKSGENGLSQLTRASFPYLKGEYFIGDKKIVFIVDGEYLDSGDGNDSLKTKAGGVTGKIGYESNNFKIHIGTTPVGTGLVAPTVVGDVSAKMKRNQNSFYLSLYRKSLKDSLTSYVGNIKNGVKFARVIENGIKLGYKKDLDKNGSFLYTDVAFNYLNGKNINSNTSTEAELLYLNYIGKDFLDKNFLGFYINLSHYQNNQYYFYPPYGGYFSPKLFLLATPRYEGYLYSDDRKFISKLTVMVGGSYINKWTQSNANLVYDIGYNLQYLFLKRLAVESGVDFRNSSNYNDVFFTLMFRYYFGNKQFFTNKDIDEFSQKVVNW